MTNFNNQAQAGNHKAGGLLAIILLLWPIATAHPQANTNVRKQSPSGQSQQSKELRDAERLEDEADGLNAAGRLDHTISLRERALAIREKALGAEHVKIGFPVKYLADLYLEKGDFEKAESLYLRSLAIYEKAVGEKIPGEENSVASLVSILAELYGKKGDHAKIEALLLRQLALYEKNLGEEHRATAKSRVTLAGLYEKKGDLAKAEPLYLRALPIYEKALGADHPNVAILLNNLASIYLSRADTAKAEPLLVRALAIREKALGNDSLEVATSLNNLAELYRMTADFVKAEPLYLRALAIEEKALGADHPEVAASLNNLAALYASKGDYIKAEPLHQRALAIREKALGADHPDVAVSLNNLAALYVSRGDTAKAEPLLVRTLAIREKALGSDHPAVANGLNNLAGLYLKKFDLAKAEPLLVRALAIREKALGAEHHALASSLFNLAEFFGTKGDYTKAEPLHLRALAIREKAFGPEHPDVSLSLAALAALYELKGDIKEAIHFQSRSNEAIESDLRRNLASGSERQKLVYLNQTAYGLDATVSLHVDLAPTNVDAMRLALTAILRRKGRALDVMADSIAALRRRASPEDQKLLDRLAAVRSGLSMLTLKGPGEEGVQHYRASHKTLAEEVEQLENQVSARSLEFRAQQAPITLESVRKAIPAGAALIEFVSSEPYALLRKARYIAYVLRSTGDPQWVALGDADAIDDAVKELRAVLQPDGNKPLSDPEREVKPRARKLDDLVMRPVRKLLGDATRLLLAPDGALNLLPFDALVDESNRYLVETYTISYLTSGRDLLRLQIPRASKQAALILADPDFDHNTRANATASTNSPGARPGDVAKDSRGLTVQPSASRPGPRLGSMQVAPLDRLSGSAEEGVALKKLLPTAMLWMQTQATEAALKLVSSPSILHISTHGSFLEDAPRPALNNERGLRIRPASTGGLEATLALNVNDENPLLRSGLFFAGANLGKSGDEDGVMTALEVAGLDLWGTKLVALSACETGLGEVKNGDGVYGLRRALVLAGSETQLMSLWAVSDAGTRDLMIDYYKGLQAGRGRAEALRDVQLLMLKSEHRKHPYFWASFIQSGEWANLDGKREESNK